MSNWPLFKRLSLAPFKRSLTIYSSSPEVDLVKSTTADLNRFIHDPPIETDVDGNVLRVPLPFEYPPGGYIGGTISEGTGRLYPPPLRSEIGQRGAILGGRQVPFFSPFNRLLHATEADQQTEASRLEAAGELVLDFGTAAIPGRPPRLPRRVLSSTARQSKAFSELVDQTADLNYKIINQRNLSTANISVTPELPGSSTSTFPRSSFPGSGKRSLLDDPLTRSEIMDLIDGKKINNSNPVTVRESLNLQDARRAQANPSLEMQYHTDRPIATGQGNTQRVDTPSGTGNNASGVDAPNKKSSPLPNSEPDPLDVFANEGGGQPQGIRPAPSGAAAEASQAAKITAPIDFDGHILNAEVKANGNVVGGHSTATGQVKVIPGTATAPNSNGVYKAQIEVADPKVPGNFLPKTNNGGWSTMFPDSWSADRVKIEVDAAFKSKTVTGNKWSGITPSGVRVEGYLTPKTTVYPIY